MRKLLLFVVLLLLAIAAVPASAGRSLDIEIEVIATFVRAPDQFTASGPAVEDGAFCAAGISWNESVVFLNPASEPIRFMRVIKEFQCNDSSGSVRIALEIALDQTTGHTTASWEILNGTGDYTSVQGKGTLVGTPLRRNSILDIYTGQLRDGRGRGGTCVDDQHEGNNSLGAARWFSGLAHGDTLLISGSICGDSDWFTVEVFDTQTCTFFEQDDYSVPIQVFHTYADGNLNLKVYWLNQALYDFASTNSDIEDILVSWNGTNFLARDSKILWVHVTGVRGAMNDYQLAIGPVSVTCQ